MIRNEMMWLFITILIPVVIIIYVLFAPFYLEVDSAKGLLRIRFHRLASALILAENSSLITEIRVIVWRWQIDLLKKKEESKSALPQKKESGQEKLKVSFSQVKAIIRSFKINTCYVNLDFEDAELNAKIFPVFWGLNRLTGKAFYVNFIGENEIKLEIQNNIARILWAYVFK